MPVISAPAKAKLSVVHEGPGSITPKEGSTPPPIPPRRLTDTEIRGAPDMATVFRLKPNVSPSGSITKSCVPVPSA